MSSTSTLDLKNKGFTTIRMIGRGQYASACLVSRAPGEYFVAKQVALDVLNETDRRLAEQEVLLLRSLNHTNIVRCYDSFVQSNTLIIITEYCAFGDLRRHIKFRAQQTQPFAEEEIMRWFVQLLDGLAYIHGRKVLHRDLKTSNIFLKGVGGSIACIGDFGISRVLDGTLEAAQTVVGTPVYMAPEICRSESYSFGTDLWALGCILYELCTLKHAFAADNLLGLVYRIVHEEPEPVSDVLYSKELRGLIERLLRKSPTERPSAASLLVDEYVAWFIDNQPSSPVSPGGTPYSLRPGASANQGSPSGRVPAPPQHPPPTVAGFLPEGPVQLVMARLKKKLLAGKIHWVRVFADYDKAGRGGVPADIFETAILNLDLGLGKSDLRLLVTALAKNQFIAVDDFRRALDAVPAALMLAPAPGSEPRPFLALLRDIAGFRKDLLAIDGGFVGLSDLRDLLGRHARLGATPDEFDKILVSLDKVKNSDSVAIADIAKILPVASPVLGPTGQHPAPLVGSAVSLLPGQLAANPHRGQPRMPGSPGSPKSPVIDSSGMHIERLLRKIDRHVSRRGLRGELKKLMNLLGRIPLGVSDSEALALKEYFGTSDGSKMEEELSRVPSETGENMATLFGVDSARQLIEELANRSMTSDGYVEETDLRKAVMRIVPFFLPGVLDSFVLSGTVKNGAGQLDLVDFAIRCGVAPPQRKPFASLTGGGNRPSPAVSDDTFVALAGRTLVRLEELGISELGISGLLKLADVYNDELLATETVSRVLETVPLGLSSAEAETLTLRCTGGLGVAGLSDIAAQVQSVLEGKLAVTLTAQLDWIRSQLRKLSPAASEESTMDTASFGQWLRMQGIEEEPKIKALVMFCDKQSVGSAYLLRVNDFVTRFRKISTNRILAALLLK